MLHVYLSNIPLRSSRGTQLVARVLDLQFRLCCRAQQGEQSRLAGESQRNVYNVKNIIYIYYMYCLLFEDVCMFFHDVCDVCKYIYIYITCIHIYTHTYIYMYIYIYTYLCVYITHLE